MYLQSTPATLCPRKSYMTQPAFGGRKNELNSQIKSAFEQQNFRLSPQQVKTIKPRVTHAVEVIKTHPNHSSQVDFTAIQIAQDLKLDLTVDTTGKDRIVSALKTIANGGTPGSRPVLAWEEYFTKTVGLNQNRQFLALTAKQKFSPVKISWEDIDRDQGSSVGKRISDVGIWVRRNEADPQSAELALSVRRDSNFRDKVLVVPSENIKIHTKVRGKTKEVTLAERLKELGLASEQHDKNVIVSNQFAVVPVPSKDMKGASKEGKPPRVAFNFSVFPYGSNTMVITDVIEGSFNAVVGKGGHQLLYANINGKKAPFTASRAEDRPDLVAMEKELKSQGMDVDVQRYYLIQVPLKEDARNLQLSNMGTPPSPRWPSWGGPIMPLGAGPMLATAAFDAMEAAPVRKTMATSAGLAKVAIGHGESEGKYNVGSGYQNQRAEEPIRVTVVYFVTPKGEVTEKDMDSFAKAFKKWDQKAIWGGSFVVPESK